MADQSTFQILENNPQGTLFSVTNGFLKPNDLSAKQKEDLHKRTLENLKSLTPYRISEKLFPLDLKLDLDTPLRNHNFFFHLIQIQIAYINYNCLVLLITY